MADVRADQIRLVPARHHAGCAHQHRAPAQTHAKIESKRRARTYANPVEMVENANNALIHKIADWLDSAYLRRKTCSARARSEEHTSELQSPDHLVCRLLLEKKNCTYCFTSCSWTIPNVL